MQVHRSTSGQQAFCCSHYSLAVCFCHPLSSLAADRRLIGQTLPGTSRQATRQSSPLSSTAQYGMSSRGSLSKVATRQQQRRASRFEMLSLNIAHMPLRTVDLLVRMLHPDPKQRLSLAEVRRHDWYCQCVLARAFSISSTATLNHVLTQGKPSHPRQRRPMRRSWASFHADGGVLARTWLPWRAAACFRASVSSCGLSDERDGFR